MRVLGFILVSALIFLSAGGGYYYSEKKHQTDYSSGYSVGVTDGKAQRAPELKTAYDQISSLESQNTQLATSYDNLRTQAINILGQSMASRYKPVSCYSNTYGITSQFTSTTCY